VDNKYGKNLVRWYQNNKEPHPWRLQWNKTKDPYVVWVSEIMLQQTQIKTVTPKYIQFLKRFPTVVSLSKATEEQLRDAISGLGYYRRFRMMLQAAKHIVEDLGGVFPSTYDELLNLPGVGVYTASAVSSICFDEPYPVIDGNVERVLCRLYDIRKPVNDPKLKKEYPKLVESFFYTKKPGDFNQGMMELGQQICRPSSPSCSECVFSKACLAHERKSQTKAPGPKIKKSFKEVFCEVEVLRRGKKIGLIKRGSESSFLKETLGFKNSLVSKAPESQHKLFKHTITNHKITGFVSFHKNKAQQDVEWYDLVDLENILHTRFDLKALEVLKREINKST